MHSRELRPDAFTDGGHDAQKAQARHPTRRQAARPPTPLDTRGLLWGAVATMLSWPWLPQQIAETLRRLYPDDPDFHAAHELIDTAIDAHA